jgi:hypothetical protein
VKQVMVIFLITITSAILTSCAFFGKKAIDAKGADQTQKPKADTDANATGGRDVRQTIYNVAATGSGWPLAIVFLVMWWRERQKTPGAVATTSAIRDMGEGPQRRRLLKSIGTRLPEGSRPRKHWDRFLNRRKLRATSTKAPTAPRTV